MKFELDTENKTIKLKEEVNLNDFFTKVDDYIYKSVPPSYTPPTNPNSDPNNIPNIYC